MTLITVTTSGPAHKIAMMRLVRALSQRTLAECKQVVEQAYPETMHPGLDQSIPEGASLTFLVSDWEALARKLLVNPLPAGQFRFEFSTAAVIQQAPRE